MDIIYKDSTYNLKITRDGIRRARQITGDTLDKVQGDPEASLDYMFIAAMPGKFNKDKLFEILGVVLGDDGAESQYTAKELSDELGNQYAALFGLGAN